MIDFSSLEHPTGGTLLKLDMISFHSYGAQPRDGLVIFSVSVAIFLVVENMEVHPTTSLQGGYVESMLWLPSGSCSAPTKGNGH